MSATREAGPPVIETHTLTKAYGPFGALQGLDLRVPAGSVFALVGASGAGKTTTIKLLLNLIGASGGSATVLGVDSRALRAAEFSKIGYVSENQVLPARLRVGHFFDYLRPLYPTWDRALEDQLREQLALPSQRRIGELSHGMRIKMTLACALPFRPSLLVLDEPLSGLDALARDEIIGGFLHRAASMSILVSSHELDEVERFATHVAFLHEGRLLFQGSIAQLAAHARPLLDSGENPAGTQWTLRAIFVAIVRAQRSAVPSRGAGA
jgi:ABC-2 type transport system ATP-binding protein